MEDISKGMKLSVFESTKKGPFEDISTMMDPEYEDDPPLNRPTVSPSSHFVFLEKNFYFFLKGSLFLKFEDAVYNWKAVTPIENKWNPYRNYFPYNRECQVQYSNFEDFLFLTIVSYRADLSKCIVEYTLLNNATVSCGGKNNALVLYNDNDKSVEVTYTEFNDQSEEFQETYEIDPKKQLIITSKYNKSFSLSSIDSVYAFKICENHD